MNTVHYDFWKLKWPIVLLLFVLIASGISNAGVPWTYTNTGINHTIIIDTSVHPSVNGLPLDPGDYIGAFYDSGGTLACGGYEMWTGTGAISVAAFGSDLTPPSQDGFTSGEVFKWKIWRHSDGSVITSNATYRHIGGIISDTGRYVTNGLSSINSLTGISRFFIYANAGPDGIIIPSGIDTIPLGANQKFTISPNTGYHVDSVIVDGIKVDSTTSYTFINDSSDHTIKAIFKINSYTILAGSGLHGYILPNGAVNVDYGVSQQFRIAPDSGCYVDSVIVDGIPVDSTTSYTFISVTSNHTIHASFVPNSIGVSFNLTARWNLISIPVGLMNDSVRSIFPSSSGTAFSYSGGGYSAQNRFENGIGYWLLVPSPLTKTMIGGPITAETINVTTGWNLLGSVSSPVAVTSIQSDPAGLVTSNFFGYQDGYTIIDTIQPGEGYWVKMSNDGQLILNSGNTAPHSRSVLAGQIRIVPISELPPPPPNMSAEQSDRPINFYLAQNYPNPFNPTTTITFSLAKSEYASLTIYDLNGREITSFANKKLSPGTYSFKWNGCAYVSGVYYVQLRAGSDYISTRKMMLLK